MTPKEKAIELVSKMEKDFQYFASREISIQHALIAVDEVLKSQNNIYGVNNRATTFYLDVKQEIEKL